LVARSILGREPLQADVGFHGPRPLTVPGAILSGWPRSRP
jgi:hypothetical protein